MKKKLKRKILKAKYADIYKIYCPDSKLRYKCYYCGLSAPQLDHVPPIAAIESLIDAGYSRDDIDFLKVPCCSECNVLAKDEPHLKLSERFLFVKELLFKKYHAKYSLPKWEPVEIQELDYSLQVLIQAHHDFVQLLDERLAYGFKSQDEACETLKKINGIF